MNQKSNVQFKLDLESKTINFNHREGLDARTAMTTGALTVFMFMYIALMAPEGFSAKERFMALILLVSLSFIYARAFLKIYSQATITITKKQLSILTTPPRRTRHLEISGKCKVKKVGYTNAITLYQVHIGKRDLGFLFKSEHTAQALKDCLNKCLKRKT